MRGRPANAEELRDLAERQKVRDEYGLLELHRKYAAADFKASRLHKICRPEEQSPEYKFAKAAASAAHGAWYEAFQKAEAEEERRFGPRCYAPAQDV